MKILYAIIFILLLSCQSENKKELKQLITNTSNLFVKNECPDSAITFEEYKNYYSKDLALDQNILSSFDTSKQLFLNALNSAIKIEDLKNDLKIFELFKRQKDSINVLVPLKKAKLVKGESPYSEEYYIYNSDTLFASSDNPVYYYFDDSIRIIEYYYYDNVEGCSFGKTSEYINKNNIFLVRSYNFRDNCDNNEYKWTAQFEDTYSFIIKNTAYNFEKKLEFYTCRYSEYDCKYIYMTENKSAITNNRNKDYIELIKLQ